MLYTRYAVCGVAVVVLALPLPISASLVSSAHRCGATHEAGRQHQQHLQRAPSRRQREHPSAASILLSGFVQVPSRYTSTRGTLGQNVRHKSQRPHSHTGIPWPRGASIHAAGCASSTSPLAVMKAAGSKSKGGGKAARKRKSVTSSTGSGFGGGGGGFGAAATATASSSKAETAGPAASQAPRDVSGYSSRQGELPDDDFATFPPLSAATLKSVMGVDVFDLPPGGVAARDEGQQYALPMQVLECIRDRHGMPEFGGGRQVLDRKYTSSDDTMSASAVESGPDDSEVKQQKPPGELPTDDHHPLLFPGLRLLHAEPPVLGVDDFFTPEECDEYISRSLSPPPPAARSGETARGAGGGGEGLGPHMQRSATLGADVDAVAQRTSTTWFHRYSAVPELMAKASALVGVPFEEGRWEEAQTVRYRPGEKFTWHLDALPPTPELASKGGQRIATLLVYLTDLPEGDGGATAFRDLGPLRVRPRKGSALLFFPSCGGAPECPFDIRTLHAGEVVRPGGQQDKWIAQLWLRESRYTPTVPKGNEHASAESAVEQYDTAWRKKT